MQSQNLQALSFFVNTLDNGDVAWLVTLLGIWGSAPRPVGSLLAVGPALHSGSLSGGCLEEKLLQELRDGQHSSDTPKRLAIGVSQEEARQYRLPCGGQMQLLIETVQPDSDQHRSYRCLLQILTRRTPLIRRVNLVSGHVNLVPARERLGGASLTEKEGCLVHQMGPHARLLLVGANLVAEQLALLADGLEMEVWVCDPRPQAFAQWPLNFTHNETAFPDDLIRHHFQAEEDIIITLAHDPRVDDMALMEALNSPAFYIGALGSQRTTAQRRERLRQLDISETALARLRAPVGLDIGSKTPIEIAIAIAAELIAVRSQRPSAAYTAPANCSTTSSTKDSSDDTVASCVSDLPDA